MGWIWLLPHSQTISRWPGNETSGITDKDVPMFQVGSVTAGSGRGCVPSGHGPSAQEGKGEDSQTVCLRGLWIKEHLEVRYVCVCVCLGM